MHLASYPILSRYSYLHRSPTDITAKIYSDSSSAHLFLFLLVYHTYCLLCVCCAISKAKMKYECLRLCVYSPPIHVLLLASGLNPSAHSQDCFRQTYALARQSLVVRHRPFSSGKLIFRYVLYYYSFTLYFCIIYLYYVLKLEKIHNMHAHNIHAPHTLANTVYCNNV